MPIIDIIMPDNALTEEAKKELPTKLGNLALGYEGLKGSHFAEKFTWVYTHELPSTHVTQVAGPLQKPIYRIRFTTLQTLLDDESKKNLGIDVAHAIYELEGSQWDEQEAHNRVWVFFEDVRQGDWMAGAEVNNIPDLRKAVEQEQAVAQ